MQGSNMAQYGGIQYEEKGVEPPTAVSFAHRPMYFQAPHGLTWVMVPKVAACTGGQSDPWPIPS